MQGIDELEVQWNRAAAHPPQGDAFCCRTEWQFACHEAFAPERRLHLRAHGDSVIGFAEREDPRFGRLLEPLEAHWLFGCPLLGPRAAAMLADLLPELASADGPPAVILSGMQRGTALVFEIVERFFHRYEILAFEPNLMRSSALSGGLDGYLSRRSGHWRRNLRAQRRRATDRGVWFERHVPHDEDHADALYARMLAVEATSWKGLGRCGMAESPSREFYALMLRRLARSGGGRVMFARHGERDIGFIFGGLAGTTYRGQQFSYADDWSRESIGNLLQLEQLRWLCEEGAERYDMGPKMDYKQHWTEIETRLDTLLLRPRP